MVSLEDKIKELEAELELKRAFLSVRISFGAGNKFSQETKDKVIDKLKSIAAMEAEGYQTVKVEGETFSIEEIVILKQMVASVLAKTGVKTAPKSDVPPTPEEPKGMGAVVSKAIQAMKDQAVRAQVLTMDNVDRSLRAKIDPLSIVQVVGKMDNNTAFVRDEKGFQFHIPMDDLDFDYNK